MKDSERNTKILTIILLVLIVITAAVIILALLWSMKSGEPEGPEETQTSTEEESTEIWSTEEETSEIESEEETSYPEPGYDFDTDEITIEVPGIKKEYKIAWVSDLHMVTDLEAADDVLDADLEAVKARYDFFVTEDGTPGEELLPNIIDFLNYGRYDGIIFGGDMLDYCSESNMELLKSEFGRLNKKVPWLYIRADHDYGFWYGGDAFTETDAENMHKEMSDGDDLERKFLDFDEFVILGVNRSTKDMMPGQYDILEGMLADAGEKPVIVATHVPYASRIDDENEVRLSDKSMEVRNKPYYWGEGDYVPNDVTSAFMDKIYGEDTQVNTVLAGHLHAGWDGQLTKQVRQHIFVPAYLGSIGIINVVPEE